MEGLPLNLVATLVLFVLAAEFVLAGIVLGCDFLTWMVSKVQRLFSGRPHLGT